MASKITYPRRIHISPIGFEIDRVVLPLIQMEADRVWLIIEREPSLDKGRPYFDKVKEDIHEKIEKCEIKIKYCDFDRRDLYDVLRAYRDIIEEEKDNQIFVNVSTGTKIHSIAGMMACMIFKDLAFGLIPYYAKPEEYLPLPREGKQMSTGCSEINELPNYKIERPPECLIKVLKVIDEQCGSEEKNITKRELIKELVDRDLLILSDSARKTPKNEKVARYLALQRKYIDPLTSWKFIKITEPKKRGKIQITQEGKNILKFLD
jgi:hypothetical protein